MITFFPETREWLYDNLWQMIWVSNQHLPGVTEESCKDLALSSINSMNDNDMLSTARWVADQLKAGT